MVRPGDQDWTEEDNGRPSRYSRELGRLHEEIERVSAFGVDIHADQCNDEKRGRGYCLESIYDTAKSRWRLELDYNAPPNVLRKALWNAWVCIAIGDASEDRAYWGATDADWDDAALYTTFDFKRFYGAERVKMAQHFTRKAFE